MPISIAKLQSMADPEIAQFLLQVTGLPVPNTIDEQPHLHFASLLKISRALGIQLTWDFKGKGIGTKARSFVPGSTTLENTATLGRDTAWQFGTRNANLRSNSLGVFTLAYHWLKYHWQGPLQNIDAER